MERETLERKAQKKLIIDRIMPVIERRNSAITDTGKNDSFEDSN